MGTIFDKTAFDWDTCVTGFQVDRYKRIKISSLMKLHQQIGEMHLNAFGTSSDKMQKNQNVAFVFTKVNILIHRLPLMNENIKLRTWCSALKGVRFTRNYVAFSEAGDILTETKAEVTTINLSDRKIVRPKEVDGFDDFLYNENLPNLCEYPQKLNFPDCNCNFSKRKICFSDIDFNGHVNNTVYADICMDCLPQKLQEKQPKSFLINFSKEIMPDSLLSLKTFTEDDSFFISGEVLDDTKFTAKFMF